MSIEKKSVLPQIAPLRAHEAKNSDDRIQAKHTWDIFEQENKGRATPFISSNVLKAAPRGFFDEIIEEVGVITNIVRTEISNGEQGGKIADLNKNPMNEKLRKECLDLIMAELTRQSTKRPEFKKARLQQEFLYAMVINEIIGLGILEPLWQDNTITEIMVNGPFKIDYEYQGQIYRLDAVKFRDAEHLEALIIRLYNSINKNFSKTNPGEKARLHDNSRLFAVPTTVAPDGPNFNIRKHTVPYWSPADIIAQGTANEEIMHFLGNLIYYGMSFVIIGGTGTGKTTLLNALTGFYPTNKRILTLEKNLEMKPHPGKLYAAAMETVTGLPGSINPHGVTMRDLVESALQMRPDNIIIGEVTDAAAYDLCQALNTGHAGASTVHANNIEAGMTRLMSLVSQSELIKGKATLELIANAFDFVIMIDRDNETGKRVIRQIAEIKPHPVLNKNTNELMIDTEILWELEENIEHDDEGNRIRISQWIQRNPLSEEKIHDNHLNLNEELTWEFLNDLSTL